MILGMYSVYDKFTGYLIPAFYQNDEQAIRAFAHDIKSNEMSLINANPEDFNLQKVGLYNTDTGEVEPLTPKILCDAGQFVRK
jgi:hypothetical protein